MLTMILVFSIGILVGWFGKDLYNWRQEELLYKSWDSKHDHCEMVPEEDQSQNT